MEEMKNKGTKMECNESHFLQGNYFFWLTGVTGSKIRYSIIDKRMRANHPTFCDPVFICLECRSYRKSNPKMKGHLAMIYQDKGWELYQIKIQTSTRIVAYKLDPHTFLRKGTKVTLEHAKHDFFLKYVNIYLPDNILSEKSHVASISNPCSINVIDGCLDAAISPSTIVFRDDPLQPTKCSIARKRCAVWTDCDVMQKKRKGISNYDDIEKEWLTIYVTDKNPLDSITSSPKAIVMIPGTEMSVFPKNPFFTKVFHAIHKSDVGKLDNILESCYEERLEALSVGKYTMVGFHHSKQPVRFSVLSREEFKMLPSLVPCLNKFQDCEEPFYWNISRETNSHLPGVVVSMWDTHEITEDIFPRLHYQRMQDRVGRGFGDRNTVPCGGVNVYFGANNSKRTHPSPIYGPGTRCKVDYNRKYYSHDEYHQELVERIDVGSSILLEHAKKVDKDYMEFMERISVLTERRTCARLLWTQGTSKRRITYLEKGEKLVTKEIPVRRNYNAIGFYNKPHFDLKDKISSEKVMKIWKKKERYSKRAIKLRKMMETIGIGFPTTVGYNFVSPEDVVNIRAYFMIWGFVTPLTKRSFHHFYGWSLPHCSVVPIFMNKSIVRITNNHNNEEENVYIGAFGCNNRFQC